MTFDSFEIRNTAGQIRLKELDRLTESVKSRGSLIPLGGEWFDSLAGSAIVAPNIVAGPVQYISNTTINYNNDIFNITNTTVNETNVTNNYNNTTNNYNGGTVNFFGTIVNFDPQTHIYIQGELELFLRAVTWSSEQDDYPAQNINGLSVAAVGDVNLTGFIPYDVNSNQLLFVVNRGPGRIFWQNQIISAPTHRITMPWASNWWQDANTLTLCMYDTILKNWLPLIPAPQVEVRRNFGYVDTRRAIDFVDSASVLWTALPAVGLDEVQIQGTVPLGAGNGRSWECYRHQGSFGAFTRASPSTRIYYLAGVHVGSLRQALYQGTLPGNTIFAVPMIFPGGGTIQHLAVGGPIGTCSASSFKLGIYKYIGNGNNAPGALIYDGPQTAVAVPGGGVGTFYELAVNFTPDINTLYWFCLWFDGGSLSTEWTLINTTTGGTNQLEPGLASQEILGFCAPNAVGSFNTVPGLAVRAALGYAINYPNTFPNAPTAIEDPSGSAPSLIPAIGCSYT